MGLYDGPMAGSYHNHRGSGHNWLCMHPSPQKPVGWSSANNDGALLYGVEYQGHGNQISSASHVRQDAACAVCQWELHLSLTSIDDQGMSTLAKSFACVPQLCVLLLHECACLSVS